MALDLVPEQMPQMGASAAETKRAADLFEEAVSIMARLRGPGGCPWDREQTPETLRKYMLEETYEVLDAIDRRHAADLCEELGDLLLQVLFYAQMASEAGDYTIADVVRGLSRKLVRRHPHVFGGEASAAAGNTAQLETAGSEIGTSQVLANWYTIKQMERESKATDEVVGGRLAGVLRAQPALLEAGKLGSAAAKCGFDWPDAAGLLAKVREEADEVEAEIGLSAEGAAPSPELRMEVGDLLFIAANLARRLHVDPEMALRDANAKFRRRFGAMEKVEATERRDGGLPLEQRSLDELEELWQQAKRLEKHPAGEQDA